MTDDLIWIPEQTAVLGSDEHYPEEAPAQPVSVQGFWMQARPVTNAEFTKTLASVLSRPAIFPVPAFVAKLAFGQMGEEVLLGSQRVEPARQIGVGGSDDVEVLRQPCVHGQPGACPAGAVQVQQRRAGAGAEVVGAGAA